MDVRPSACLSGNKGVEAIRHPATLSGEKTGPLRMTIGLNFPYLKSIASP